MHSLAALFRRRAGEEAVAAVRVEGNGDAVVDRTATGDF